MTKKQWNLLRPGDRVKQGLEPNATKTALVKVTWFATVTRFNSNGSQCLIKYDSGNEIWKGRLGIELA
jgi:hypothetical protein